MYRYTIFNEKIQEVQTVIADHVMVTGTVLAFSTEDDIELVYNLPAGYSVSKEDA